jgi:hypothetical protein
MFILSHGRADRIYTIKALQLAGYTGRYYILIDNEDKTSAEYYARHKDKVIMFDKLEIAKTFDTADNFDNRKTIVYARNACFEIAERLGIKYFMELDDDYTTFCFRFNRKGEFKSRKVQNLDALIMKMLDFYVKSNALVLALAQGGDYIGGKDGSMGGDLRLKRKAMNTLLCCTENKFSFLGRINEDVNSYVRFGNLGKLFLTTNVACITQKATQSNSGGMTDVYLDSGTYIKSFYSIMYAPSCVRISRMGNKHRRLHHKIRWKNTTPCILDEKYRRNE